MDCRAKEKEYGDRSCDKARQIAFREKEGWQTTSTTAVYRRTRQIQRLLSPWRGGHRVRMDRLPSHLLDELARIYARGGTGLFSEIVADEARNRDRGTDFRMGQR